MIRPAVETDIPAIVRMARLFYDTTTYTEITPMDDDTVADLAQQLMGSVLLVAEQQNQLVGMVGLVIAPFFFNRSILTAHEVVWWVDPGARLRIQRCKPRDKRMKTIRRTINPTCRLEQTHSDR